MEANLLGPGVPKPQAMDRLGEGKSPFNVSNVGDGDMGGENVHPWETSTGGG